MSVTVYTLDNCGYCKVAKELLKFKDVVYTEVHVPQDFSTRDFMTKFPKIKTFPLIIENEGEVIIGGFTDLQEWLLKKEKTKTLTDEIKGLTL
jgi:glutaredoxin 3